MGLANKDKIRALLKSIETGNAGPIAVVNEAKYIQHNPQTHEGSEGLAALFLRLSKTNPKVSIVRAFEDRDFVFAHTEYDFSNRNIGFEVFRFEDGQAVEHWDNIQRRQGPNEAGHSMVDGRTDAVDHDQTEANREVVRRFVQTILVQSRTEDLPDFVEMATYIEHNASRGDGGSALRDALEERSSNDLRLNYQHLHRILAEGSFVLSVCEGYRDQVHSSFYDLFRLKNGKIVEHWDTVEKIAPKSEWKNENGKF